MIRRITVLLAALMLASLAAPLAGHAAEGARDTRLAGPDILPEDGALFAAYVKPDEHNGLNRRTAVTNFEALVGRQIAVERVYHEWNDVWPMADDYWSRDQGHILYLSWNGATNDGTEYCDWSDIANGVWDARIHEQAANIIAFGSPMIFSFHHEPNTAPPWHVSCGTGEEYKAAWQRIHDIFVGDGVTNVLYAFTFTAQGYDKGRGDEFYPGNSIIDVIAADGYNWFNCPFHPGPWREFEQIFDSFHAFGLSKGKPMYVAEYGSGEDPADPNRKAQWFTNGIAQTKLWPEIKGLSYFNVGGADCARYVDTSPQSLSAYQALGADPYANPPVPMRAVGVSDFSFDPAIVVPSLGGGVTWTFNGPSNHTVTDNSGMGLFDSGSQGVGATFKYFFLSAGSYKYHCTIHTSMNGTVKVKPTAVPPTGGVGTTFTITWAADKAPTAFVFDVQIKGPGGTWKNWKMGQTGQSATFVPDQGTGTYQFRGRYKDTVNSKATGYSAAVNIVVS
jgi:plastocyanin